MSSERSVPAVDLRLGASRGLSLVVSGAHAAGTVALVLSGLPLWMGMAGAAGLATSGVVWIRKHGLRLSPGAVVRVVLEGDGTMVLIDRSGRVQYGSLAFGTTVGTAFVVLVVRQRRFATTTLAVTAEAADREEFRRLRMRLRLAPPPSVSLPARMTQATIGVIRGLAGQGPARTRP